MNSASRVILGCALLAVAAPAFAQASAHDRLFQLFKESDEAYLQRNPLQALYRGDYRYADRLGDLYSDAHYQAEKAAAEHDLASLGAIQRAELSADDQLAYDVFEFQTKDALRGLQSDLLPLRAQLLKPLPNLGQERAGLVQGVMFLVLPSHAIKARSG